MMFSNSKKTFKNMGSEFSMRMDLEVSRHFIFYRLLTNQRSYFDSRKMPCGHIPQPLNKGILSVFGRFFEDYL
jgi:hypothetical protein